MQVTTFFVQQDLSGVESQSGLIFKEDSLPFKIRPPLTRSPLIESRYANPSEMFICRRLCIPPAKTSGRKGPGSKLASFLQPPLSGTQTQQQMVTHSRSKHLQPLRIKLFKMEIAESIRLSLQQYLSFHYLGQTYQFKVLPFGDWLIRGPTKDFCHRDTQTLLALCQDLNWLVNHQKLGLEPLKQVFNFVGYQYNLSQGVA